MAGQADAQRGARVIYIPPPLYYAAGEEYLTQRFGPTYTNYQSRVRRWL